MNSTNRLNRRRILQGGATGIAALLFPSRVFAKHASPGELLNVAAVGVGGMGDYDLASIASDPKVRIVALCDVDSARLAAAQSKHPDAKAFADWRRLFDEMHEGIDAVLVSTPDHMHGPIALAAMSLGKHVYCQKPIAHNLRECRAMTEMASAKGVVTQMGTQIHSHGAYRSAVATLQAGVIGKVSEAHLWVSKSWAGPKGGRPERSDPIPATLDWDLWLGGAPERPYVNGLYHPANWRGWRDFGAGTLGDMGCHIFDPVFSALGLGSPLSVTSKGPAHGAETFAANSDIEYVFPGTAHTAKTLKMRWTDGSSTSRPRAELAQLPAEVALPGAGSFLVGDKGVMVIPHWSAPQLYRAGAVLEAELTTLEDRNHWHEWTAACRGEGGTSTPFDYSGPLTEAVLIGTLAGCAPGKTFEWDAKRMTLGDKDLDAFIGREYREGWTPAKG